MNYKVIVSPLAQSQIDEHYIFYKNNVSKLVAQNFQKELSNSYKTLKSNPFFTIYNNLYRILPLNKFPYIIFYEVNEVQKIVKVVAIFNTNQNTVKYPK